VVREIVFATSHTEGHPPTLHRWTVRILARDT